MKLIDKILNNITMYRLVLYGLLVLCGAGFWFAVTGRLHVEPAAMAASFAVILGSCFAADYIFGRIWRIPRNSESWLITALILFLILQPGNTFVSLLSLGLAGAIADVSKYIFNWQGKHVFNPAAFAAAFLSLTAVDPATWWVGDTALWPFALIVGLAVVRKIRRFTMVLTFVGVSLILQISMFIFHHQSVVSNMQNILTASPLIFMATIMLTEPATMPPRKFQQVVFASIVGILYVTAWRVGSFNVYPEVALLMGNLYAFVISPKYRLRMQLKEIQKISDRVYNYVFQPERPIKFLPGQYMEWTLPGVPFDSRGNRRTFTIASSPTEADVQLGIKYYDPPSMFKRTFSRLRPGDTIYASQLAGNFTLNGNERKKLVFIAGGIGVTPFRSMVKYIIDNQIQSDIVLIYMVSKPDELAYAEVFQEAQAYGIRFIPITSQKDFNSSGIVSVSAKLDSEFIAGVVPDFEERIFYVSGPDAMVRSTKQLLNKLGVKNTHIKTDYFSGY